MRRQTQIGLAIGAALLVAVAVYTACYAYFRLFIIDHWRNILFVLALAIVITILVARFVNRSGEREELIRRLYLSHEWIYNHEIGYARISQIVPDGDAYEFVTFAADALVEMSYGFAVADAPENFEPEFMVSTKVFDIRQTGDGAVVKQWSGSLHRVVSDPEGQRGTYEVAAFENAAELAQLLEENEALS